MLKAALIIIKKNRMNKILIIILIMGMSSKLLAQNSIEGTVSNKENSELIIGASVYIPELGKGIYTDKKGEFSLKNLPIGDFIIKISYIGYKTYIEHIKISKNSKITLDIQLSTIFYQANEAIITAAGYTSQHHYAIKVESIDATDLETSANINIMDKMDKIPGLNMISQGPGISTPNIRGLSLSNVLVLTDGFRMSNFQFSEHHPYLVSNYGIEKVELIKGPASLLYGADAVGGVLNFISEKPASVGKLEADINSVFFSNTNGFQNNIGVKAHGQKWFWGIRAGIQQHKDFAQGGGEAVVNSRFGDKDLNINTGINSKLGSYKLTYIYKSSQIGISNDMSKKLVDNNNYSHEHFYQNLDFNMIKSQNRIYLGKTKLQANFSYQNNRRRLFTKDIDAVDMTLQSFGYEVKASRSLHEISKKNDSKIVFGIQGNYSQNNLGDAPVIVIPNYFQNDLGAFALIQQDFGSKFHFQLGSRFDYRSIYIPSFYSVEYGGNRNIDTTYNNMSYTIGSTYELSKHIFLRANIASAFRTANIAELTQDGIHESRYERGNPNLKSQKSNEIDLGFHYHNAKFSFDIAGFYNNIDNYIFLSPTTDTIATGQKIYKYGQTNSTLYGFETGFNYVPIKQIEFHGNYAYTIGKQHNGDYLPFIPQNKINTSIKYKLLHLAHTKGLFMEIGGTYAFSKNDISPFEEESDAYFLLNASIASTFIIGKQKIKLGIYATNILDTKYMDHLSTLSEEGYYNMGRNISLKISIPIEINY